MHSSGSEFLFPIAILTFTISFCASDSGGTNGSTPVSTHLESESEISTTAIPPELACQYFNNSCEECVRHQRCYYCYSTSQCLYYPFSSMFPSSRDCNWGEVRWGVCWFNFKALTISLACMFGVLFICISVCLYCCCRKKKTRTKAKYAQEEIRREREREERRIRAEERKLDRKLKNDEIRKKYGLMKEDQPYQRFDA